MHPRTDLCSGKIFSVQRLCGLGEIRDALTLELLLWGSSYCDSAAKTSYLQHTVLLIKMRGGTGLNQVM